MEHEELTGPQSDLASRLSILSGVRVDVRTVGVPAHDAVATGIEVVGTPPVRSRNDRDAVAVARVGQVDLDRAVGSAVGIEQRAVGILVPRQVLMGCGHREDRRSPEQEIRPENRPDSIDHGRAATDRGDFRDVEVPVEKVAGIGERTDAAQRIRQSRITALEGRRGLAVAALLVGPLDLVGHSAP